MKRLSAGVAQLVEHHLAKVDVEGSNPFARSILLLNIQVNGGTGGTSNYVFIITTIKCMK